MIPAPKKVWTKQEIADKIQFSNVWLTKGLLAIYAHQTTDEKSCESTHWANGVGFNGADAEILSSFSKQLLERGFLTPKQVALARKKMMKYVGQLVRIANNK